MIKFQGCFTALITPFLNNQIDFESLEKLIHFQLNHGIEGFVVCGTTAESPTLTDTEKLQVLKFVIKVVNKKVPIIFGSGTNDTSSTIALSQQADNLEIDGLLVVVPYYNKPPQSGLIQHFEKIADAVGKPVILYNVPGRTVTSLSPDTIVTLSKHPNICGIKEANNDVNNFAKYKSKVPDNFCLLSGDDASSVSFCLLGGHGVISVCSHIAPKEMVTWIHEALQKNDTIRSRFRRQEVWIEKLYIQSNPIPVKAALQDMGIIRSRELRLPLLQMNDSDVKDLVYYTREIARWG